MNFAVMTCGVLAAVGLLACGGGRESTEGGTNTGAAARFFLPTGAEARNTINPTIESDARGNLHMIYPAYAGGDAFYAYCEAGCESQEEVEVVKLPTQGSVANAMIALDGQGRPQVLLSTMLRVYYGTCEGDCTQEASWTLSVIREYGDSEREVSGEAFAITGDGRPRFIMHSYRAFLDFGGPTPATYFVTCESDCHEAASWSEHRIADQVWEESTLRLTRAGNPRLGLVAEVNSESGKREIGAYAECDANCEDGASWTSVGLIDADSNVYVQQIDAAISLALTSDGEPRLFLLAKNEGKRSVVFFSCNTNCTDRASWSGTSLITDDRLGAGVDLALDRQDRPRVVYTAVSNIYLAACSTKDCGTDDAPWKLDKVELGSDMPTDNIFPYWNCTIAAWFLRHPSLAINAGGSVDVVYRAEDISGGTSQPDPTKPRCEAGADLTWARYAHLSAIAG